MKKILIISYYFPPLIDVGSLRALGFAKHLKTHGWEPIVLSVKNPDTSLCKVGKQKAPPGIKTFYCRSWFNLNRATWKINGIFKILFKTLNKSLKTNIVQDLTCIPDAFIGWVIPAYLEGFKIIKDQDIDVVYVSSKPFSSALTGVMLKKVTGIPLVLDFRDPASFPASLFNKNLAGQINRKATERIEKFVLSRVNKLITTTEATKEIYLKMYPFLNGNIHRVYNGYFLPPQKFRRKKKTKKFTIAYAGNFYHTLIPSETFFKSLKKIIDEKIVNSDHIEFLYIGHLREKNNWFIEAESKYELQGLLKATGYLPRDKVQKVTNECALQLLRIVPPMISTKLFEALRDGIPLLALIEGGEVERLVKIYSPNSYVITSGKVEDVVAAIVDAYNKWKKGHLDCIRNDEYLKKFCKETLTAEFVNIINDAYKVKSIRNLN